MVGGDYNFAKPHEIKQVLLFGRLLFCSLRLWLKSMFKICVGLEIYLKTGLHGSHQLQFSVKMGLHRSLSQPKFICNNSQHQRGTQYPIHSDAHVNECLFCSELKFGFSCYYLVNPHKLGRSFKTLLLWLHCIAALSPLFCIQSIIVEPFFERHSTRSVGSTAR